MEPIFQPDWMEKVVVVVIPPEKYSSVSSAMLMEIAKERDIEGVFVSMNKPYCTVIESLKESGILEKIIFVDCASKLAGDNPSGDRLVIVRNPANLTELNISITKSLAKLAKNKFLIFDSLTTLRIYSESKVATRFAHALGLKMKANKVTGLFLAVEQNSAKEMLSFFQQWLINLSS